MNGYSSNDPCVICGGKDENLLEPRFLYVVCREHYSIRPVDIPND